MSRLHATATTLVLSMLAACGSNVIREPDPADCKAAPTCDANEVEVEDCSNASCHEVEICGTTLLCEEPENQCLAEPVCDGGDTQVPSCGQTEGCYEVSACGNTIYCATDCEGLFDCDPGDTPVEACPPGASCYTVEVCGELLECIDDLLPAHGCPFSEPAGGEQCGAGVPPDCSYPTGNDCFSSYACDAGAWTFIGGGCSGSDGG